MATLFQHKDINEWAVDELKSWISSINLKQSAKKKLKKIITEQEITGEDMNELQSVKEIIESFPEINANSAKKLYNAILTVRKKQGANDDTNAEEQELKQNKKEQNINKFSPGQSIYCLDAINKKWHAATIKNIQQNGMLIAWNIQEDKKPKYDEFVESKHYKKRIKQQTSDWRQKPMTEWDSNQLIEWVICIDLTAENEDKIIESIIENEICGADMSSLQELGDIDGSFPGIDKDTTKILYNELWRVKRNGVFVEKKKFKQELKIEENETDENAKTSNGPVGECVVCLDAKRNHIIIPCGHVCICGQCKEAYEQQDDAKCPMCRGSIESILKAFF
eukprot:43324_1